MDGFSNFEKAYVEILFAIQTFSSPIQVQIWKENVNVNKFPSINIQNVLLKNLETIMTIIERDKNRNLLTNRMVTVNTVEKSWKNTVFAKYATNDWLTNYRSGKHVINLKCLLCLCYVEHIEKLKGCKSEQIKGSTNFC